MKNFAIIFLSLFIFQSISAQVNYQERAEKNLPYLIRNEILMDQIKMDDTGVKIHRHRPLGFLKPQWSRQMLDTLPKYFTS
jgi:hypothetical protein